MLRRDEGLDSACMVDSVRLTGREYCEVVNEKLLDEIGARIKEVMARTPAADIERNMRASLSALFARLDLVTREEFDVQAAVLARTREKLAALEARLAELEKAAKPN
jgi:ubiquinone biosynthesis accessory factor UbiK